MRYFLFNPVPTNYDPELAPEGCQLLTVVAGASALDTEREDPETVWVDRIMTAIHNLVPGLEENTIFCDTYTVTALANWIDKSNGSAISTGQAVGQVQSKRPPHETPIKGLYMAGDCAGPARGSVRSWPARAVWIVLTWCTGICRSGLLIEFSE